MKLQSLLFSAVMLLGLSACVVGPAYPPPVRPVGVRPVIVPVGARPYYHGGVHYYHHRGVWYRPHAGGHIIVPRPY